MPIDKETTNANSPDAQTVADYHRNADTDQRVESIHHTLGNTRLQAAFGDHDHKDGYGTPLLDGVSFTGSRSLNTASILGQVLDALETLGASDNTVA